MIALGRPRVPVVAGDPREVVRGEERPEQHRLGREEEVDPEQDRGTRELWCAAGGCVAVSVVAVGLGDRAQCAAPTFSGSPTGTRSPLNTA